MDRLNRLQALTGDAYICGEESAFQPFVLPMPKPQHLYEGTDSDDDEVIISRGRVILGNANENFNPSAIPSGLLKRILGLLPFVDTNWTCRNQYPS
jgi:hypothetical protein